MKKWFGYVLLVAALCAQASEVEFLSFDAVSEDAKDYIIKSLSAALPTADVGVLHSRSDEIFRNDGEMNEMVGLVLDVWPVRFASILKGRLSIPPYSVGYVYKPDWYVPGMRSFVIERRPPGKKGDQSFRPPYFPTLDTTDDLVRLVFLTRQTVPLKNRALQRANGMRRQAIYDDARRMDQTEFMSKYNLDSIFSNQVYSVVEGCIFHVVFPTTMLPETDLMKANSAILASAKASPPFFHRNSSLIHLSPSEASEIVYIAYLLDGDAGVEQYEEARKRTPELLLPIEGRMFKTSIGRQLFAAVAERIQKPSPKSP